MPQKQQTRENHTRRDPLFAFFLAPAVLLLFVYAVYSLIRHPGLRSGADLLLIATLAVIGFLTRSYAIKVQDRIIRLEERIRLATVLPAHFHAAIPQFTEGQLIALRFASDSELPSLAERALTAPLDPKTIKAEIKNWRPDYWRV